MKFAKCRSRRAEAAAVLVAAVLAAGPGVVAKLASGSGTELKFVASQADVPVEGRFGRFSADVDFDPTKPDQGRVNIAIDVASVDTGSADANDMLRGREFFDAGHYPQATFVSKAIVAEGGGKFRASGQFTLKGRSLPLAVPFTARGDGGGLWLEGSVPVSRLAYQVGQGEWADTGTLADPVLIRFKLYLPR